MSPPDGAASVDARRRPARAAGQRVEDCMDTLQEIERSIAGVRRSLREACAADGSSCASSQDAAAGSKSIPLRRSLAAQEHGVAASCGAGLPNIQSNGFQTSFTSLPPLHLGRASPPPGPACDHAVLRSIVRFQESTHRHDSSNGMERQTSRLVARIPTLRSQTSSEGDSDATSSAEADLRRRPSTGSHHFDIGLVRHGRASSKVKCLLPVIHPEARFIFLWLVFGWFFIVYESFSAPAFWAFDVQIDGHLFVIASLINSYFILDIVMMFFTAYHDENGVLILKLEKIARRYRKGWLWFDLVAAVPWEWLMSTTSGFATTTKSVRVMRVIRLLRCVRAIRVTKLSSFASRMETYAQARSHDGFMRFFRLFQHIGGIGIFVHWTACMWYYVGVHGDDNGKSWVNHMLVEEGGNFDPHHDQFARYWFSVYFVLETMTTVGFGDITPTNLWEVLFTSALLLLSCPCLGYLTGRVVEVTMSFYSQSRAMREKRSMLQRYFSWRHVPKQLGASMRQHLMYVWNATGGNDEVEALVKKDLSPMLRLELMYHIHGQALDSVPFLAWMRGYSVVVKEMAGIVDSINLSRGDFLFHSGEHNETVYLLRMGNVWISQNRSVFAGDHLTRSRQKAAKAKALAQIHEARMAHMVLSNTVRVWQSKEQRQHAARPLPGDPFHSPILHEAGLKIQREDLKLASAARVLQRSWRRKRAARAELHGASPGPTPIVFGSLFGDGRARPGLSRKQTLTGQTMPSGEVPGPAYFGESCLWVDRRDWALPGPRYQYSASCRTRAEVLSISRSAIGEVIDKFSPWLGERFEIFRAAVVSGQEDLDGIVPLAPPDSSFVEGDAEVNSTEDARGLAGVRSPALQEGFAFGGFQEDCLGNDEGRVRKNASWQSRVASV